MRSAALGIIVAGALLSSPATAVKIINKDSTSHDIELKCSSTSHTSVGALSTRDVGSGPCTVTIKSTGSSGSASGTTNVVIRNGSVEIE